MSNVIRSLVDEHVAIVAAVDALAEALLREPRVDLTLLTNLRLRVASLLRKHLQAEQDAFFVRLTAAEHAAIPRFYEILTRINGNRQHYSAHIARWDKVAIETNWVAYVRETHVLIDALRDVIIDEEENLYKAACIVLREEDVGSIAWQSAQTQAGAASGPRASLPTPNRITAAK